MLGIQIERDVMYAQAFGCRFCLHVGATVFYFGSGVHGRGPRVEICTPFHWFRYSRGYREERKVAPAAP